MKTFIFPFYILFTRHFGIDGFIGVELTDNQATRLIASGEEGSRFSLDEDEDILDIYDDVYNAILKNEKAGLTAEPTPVREYYGFDDNEKITEEQVDEYLEELSINVYYPKELQGLEAKRTKVIPQSTINSVIIDKSNTEEYLNDCGHREQIVYVDGGKTLYYVPKLFSGDFTVTSAVRNIGNALRNHSKITSITIEGGLTEIPERAFEMCTALTQVTIPSTVKTIHNDAFSQCKKLASVSFSEGLLVLHSTAFRACFELQELYLPASLRCLGAFICSYNNGIKELHFAGMDTEIDDSHGGDLSRQVFYVKRGSKAAKYARKNKIKYHFES